MASQVYRAVCKRTGTEVALKAYAKAKLRSRMKDQVMGEIALHSRLSHPNVLSFYAAFHDANTYWLVLELASKVRFAGNLDIKSRLRCRMGRLPAPGRRDPRAVPGGGGRPCPCPRRALPPNRPVPGPRAGTHDPPPPHPPRRRRGPRDSRPGTRASRPPRAPQGDLYQEMVNIPVDETVIARYVVLPLCSAVAYLHHNRLMHRDLKPENVVLADGTVKLADFGFAVNQRRKRALSRVGTTDFMAPEMIMVGDGQYKVFRDQMPREIRWPYDETVDVWALGVMAYELVTRNAPFTGKTEDLLIDSIQGGRYPVPKSLSAPFRDFLSKCLAKDPAQRASARALIDHEFLRLHASDRTLERFASLAAKVADLDPTGEGVASGERDMASEGMSSRSRAGFSDAGQLLGPDGTAEDSLRRGMDAQASRARGGTVNPSESGSRVERVQKRGSLGFLGRLGGSTSQPQLGQRRGHTEAGNAVPAGSSEPSLARKFFRRFSGTLGSKKMGLVPGNEAEENSVSSELGNMKITGGRGRSTITGSTVPVAIPEGELLRSEMEDSMYESTSDPERAARLGKVGGKHVTGKVQARSEMYS